MTIGLQSSLGPDHGFWNRKRVFLTGHTGFKGSWLALWLRRLGAHVYGYALAPPTEPNLFSLARIEEELTHHTADIRDAHTLTTAVHNFKPDIVLHLAAQSILRLSYDEPIETYSTNVMGTVNVLEAVRQAPSVQVALVITTDKCYENREQIWPYREIDPIGGHDPYSSSKSCAEIVVSAYGRSYFSKGQTMVASARAGNVIGGGDWAKDRLMTDLVASLICNQKPIIRAPNSIRPWQHVLEPLCGYLCAVEYLWGKRPQAPECWNFGPDVESDARVLDVAREVCRLWESKIGTEIVPDPEHKHEAKLLRLDSSKARLELGWRPRLSLSEALAMTVSWHKANLAGANMLRFTCAQIEAYEEIMRPGAAKIHAASLADYLARKGVA